MDILFSVRCTRHRNRHYVLLYFMVPRSDQEARSAFAASACNLAWLWGRIQFVRVILRLIVAVY